MVVAAGLLEADAHLREDVAAVDREAILVRSKDDQQHPRCHSGGLGAHHAESALDTSFQRVERNGIAVRHPELVSE